MRCNSLFLNFFRILNGVVARFSLSYGNFGLVPSNEALFSVIDKETAVYLNQNAAKIKLGVNPESKLVKIN